MNSDKGRSTLEKQPLIEKEANSSKETNKIGLETIYTSSDFYDEEKFKRHVTNKDLDDYIKARISLVDKTTLPIGNKNTFSKY